VSFYVSKCFKNKRSENKFAVRNYETFLKQESFARVAFLNTFAT